MNLYRSYLLFSVAQNNKFNFHCFRIIFLMYSILLKLWTLEPPRKIEFRSYFEYIYNNMACNSFSYYLYWLLQKLSEKKLVVGSIFYFLNGDNKYIFVRINSLHYSTKNFKRSFIRKLPMHFYLIQKYLPPIML